MLEEMIEECERIGDEWRRVEKCTYKERSIP
jgi:hypothetical protein